MSADPTEHRRRLEDALAGIHGWLTADEAWYLFGQVRALAERADHDLALVEIGSWKGRSAITMALALQSANRSGTVYAIDPQVPPHDNAAEFRSNIRAAGVEDLVVAVHRFSHQALSDIPETPLDVVFVDGAHEYPAVLRDLDDWAPRLRDGGLLAVNDLFWDGVNRALLDRVARWGSPFGRPRYVYNSIFFDHLPRRVWSSRDRAWLRRLRSFLLYGRYWLKAWNRLKDDPRVPRSVKGAFYRPTSRLLYQLGPKPGEG